MKRGFFFSFFFFFFFGGGGGGGLPHAAQKTNKLLVQKIYRRGIGRGVYFCRCGNRGGGGG